MIQLQLYISLYSHLSTFFSSFVKIIIFNINDYTHYTASLWNMNTQCISSHSAKYLHGSIQLLKQKLIKIFDVESFFIRYTISILFCYGFFFLLSILNILNRHEHRARLQEGVRAKHLVRLSSSFPFFVNFSNFHCNESFLVFLFPILSYPVLSYHIPFYQILSYPVLSYCILLYHSIVYCIALYSTVLYYIILCYIIQYIIVRCIVQYCIVQYCTVQFCILLYCIASYCIVLYCIVLYCIILYCIASYCIALSSIFWFKVVLHLIVLYCNELYRIVQCIVLYHFITYHSDNSVEQYARLFI